MIIIAAKSALFMLRHKQSGFCPSGGDISTTNNIKIVAADEMIRAMALGHGAGSGGGHVEGHISDKTLYIALNYQSKVDKLNADIIGSFYSVAELERLFQAVKGDPVEFPVLMAAFYGLRRSEIMGLRWQTIDFVGNTITIDHTVVQFRSKGKTKVIQKDRTKNASSCRSLPYC